MEDVIHLLRACVVSLQKDLERGSLTAYLTTHHIRAALKILEDKYGSEDIE